MTNSNDDWVKKVHTFRLKKEDEELYRYLETLPKMSKSESIRGMLLFALKYMVNSDQVFNHANANTNSNSSLEIQELKTLMETQYEVTNELKNMLIDLQQNASLSISQQDSSNEAEIVEVVDKSDKNTLDNIFSEFGVDFD